MLNKKLKKNLDKFKNKEQVAPLILNEEDIEKSINYLFDINYYFWDNNIANSDITFFEQSQIKESKKTWIELSRKIIRRSAESPAWDYQVIIIKNIDSFTNEAANALLKVFEDIPDNTLFLCSAVNPDRIIETILSRSLIIHSSNSNNFNNLNNSEKNNTIKQEIKDLVYDFFNNSENSEKLLIYLFNKNEDFDFYKILLTELLKYSNSFKDKKVIKEISDALLLEYQNWIKLRNTVDNIIMKLV